jgi:hypothetical protein
MKSMSLPNRTQSILSGLVVGFLCLAFWVCFIARGSEGKPMLLPEQSRSTILFDHLKTGALIFVATGLPTALIVFYRPHRRRQTASNTGHATHDGPKD